MAVSKIVIVGGGTAGWMSAAYLQQAYVKEGGEVPEITLIESPDIGIIGVGEATVPNLRRTLIHLELDEDEFMWNTNASFKQAIKFRNWRLPPDQDPNEHFFHPFEYPDLVEDAYEFPPLWLAYRKNGGTVPIDYAATPQPVMCEALKVPKTAESSPYLGSVTYAYHLDAVMFGRFLREKALERGITRLEDTVENVNLDADGLIRSLDTKDHGEIEADLFIDCSGFRGLLINKTLEEPFVPFGESLLCDRAFAIQIPHGDDVDGINPFTTSQALSSGWGWNIPLNDRAGNGYVYSSAFISDDEAEREFRQFLGPHSDGRDGRVLKMRVGRNRNSWVGNCIAVGLASGFVEPLESTGIYLIERSLELISEHLPEGRKDERSANAFNAKLNDEFADVIDFIVSHYCLTEREDTAFWQANKHDLKIPTSLQERLDIWRRGFPKEDDPSFNRSLFKCASWTYVLSGMGIIPEDDPVLPDGLDAARIARLIENRAKGRTRMLPFMMDHKTYLEILHDEPEAFESFLDG